MVILVLNCGSSSIKYQVIDMVSPRENSLLAKGLVERIGIEGGIITHKPTGKPRLELTTDIPNHTKGIDLIFKAITDSESGVIASLDDIRAVGHRVAHGGDFFDRSVLVDDEVINRIEQLVELAPLHNPANLKGIYAVKELCPAIPQVVCFDTSFHQSMPPRSYIYGLPYKYYEQYRVRRYGFHGTSHKFVAQKGCELAGEGGALPYRQRCLGGRRGRRAEHRYFDGIHAGGRPADGNALRRGGPGCADLHRR